METMSEALARLAGVGFGDDLVPEGKALRAIRSGVRHDPGDLAVVETVRFEGPTDPADEAVVFALTTATGEPVGTFTMAYGPSAGPEDADIVEHLHRPCFYEADIRAHQEHDHLVAVFGTRAGAEAAVEELRQLGLGSNSLGVATEERSLTTHKQIARTRLQPGEVLVAVCSHGHPDTTRDVLQRHGADLRTAPSD